MKEFDLNDEELEMLKAGLMSFVIRVSAGKGIDPAEVQILPEIVKLLLGHFDCFSCGPIYGVSEEDGKERGDDR